MHSVKLGIYDLDQCFFDTPKAHPIFAERFLRVLDMFELDEAVRTKAATMLQSGWVMSAVRECNLPQGVAQALVSAYRLFELPLMDYSYGDLHHIQTLPHEKVLVTTGFPELQHHKVDRLGVRQLFSAIHIDTVSETGEHRGKEDIFRDIMEARNLKPHQIMVVGDNPKAELGAGSRLGMWTVQTLRPKVEHWDGAHAHITSFAELKPLIAALDAMFRARSCSKT
ncbi:MAG: HAD family hydrolase [Parcubacteria group bacterium]|nr:HAD family hydrolase [Parcubacteria group bacterium]